CSLVSPTRRPSDLDALLHFIAINGIVQEGVFQRFPFQSMHLLPTHQAVDVIMYPRQLIIIFHVSCSPYKFSSFSFRSGYNSLLYSNHTGSLLQYLYSIFAPNRITVYRRPVLAKVCSDSRAPSQNHHPSTYFLRCLQASDHFLTDDLPDPHAVCLSVFEVPSSNNFEQTHTTNF